MDERTELSRDGLECWTQLPVWLEERGNSRHNKSCDTGQWCGIQYTPNTPDSSTHAIFSDITLDD